MRAHGRALAALSLLLLLALCPVTCLAEDSAAGHHNNAAEHNNVTGTMEVPPEADGAHGQHEPDEAPPHDPEHEEHPDGYFPGDPIDDQSDGHHDPMSEEEDAALHDQHLDDPSQGREGDFGGVNTPNFDKEPFLSGPHAPEFKGSDGRPIVEPHLVDPLWQEQGLEEPLRFFEPHGQVEILETYDNWNAIDEFSVVQEEEPQVHELETMSGVTCSFHYITTGLGDHATDEHHEIAEEQRADGQHPWETWRMYLYDYGTHHECTVTTTADFGLSAMNFTYARLIVTDHHHHYLKVLSSHVWPQEVEGYFDLGHSLSHPDKYEQPELPRVEGGHPEVPFPEGYGLVSKEDWHGKLSQLAVHFVPAPRDGSDL